MLPVEARIERGEGKNTENHKFKSITGIWVSKTHASMKFAARDIVDTLSMGLSPIFSMEFYGTREEKPKKKSTAKAGDSEKEDDDSSDGTDSDPTLVMKRGQHAIRVGRPDWEHIFLHAIEQAHESNMVDGGSTDQSGENCTVGVFFCGSPAIARVLQRTSQEVTAYHQYRTQQETGALCHCRILVHKENF